MKEMEQNKFSELRRINFYRRGGEKSHSGTMATDDNEAYENLDKQVA